MQSNKEYNTLICLSLDRRYQSMFPVSLRRVEQTKGPRQNSLDRNPGESSAQSKSAWPVQGTQVLYPSWEGGVCQVIGQKTVGGDVLILLGLKRSLWAVKVGSPKVWWCPMGGQSIQGGQTRPKGLMMSRCRMIHSPQSNESSSYLLVLTLNSQELWGPYPLLVPWCGHLASPFSTSHRPWCPNFLFPFSKNKV